MLVQRSVFSLLLVGLIAGLVAQAQDANHEHESAQLPKLGVAVITPTKGNKVRGVLRLVQKGDEIKIMGRVTQLTPGEHGFHIHEFGDRRGSDGKATGGHYNPKGHDHGSPGGHSHSDDLGNIEADQEGVAQVNITMKGTPLHFVLGRAFVVHAGKDDLKSQPSGAAGARIATGVIGIGNPEFTYKKAE